MQILGIDFTSRPTRRKPLTCAYCTLQGETLAVDGVHTWTGFDGFESALRQSGPWVMGIDFPFGQSRRFVETVGWPLRWDAYVRHVGGLTRAEFRAQLDAYRAAREPGDKEHRRETDKRVGSISPQKLYGVPVALMFFEGAPRLLDSGVQIPGLRQGDPDRAVVEAYPGTLARGFLGRQSYKHDTRARQCAEHATARSDLLRALAGDRCRNRYGVTASMPASLFRGLVDDPTGDLLDALACAVQAAWAYRNKSDGFGAPLGLDPLEGWIAEP